MTFPEDADERVAEPYSPYEAGSGDMGGWRQRRRAPVRTRRCFVAGRRERGSGGW